MSGFNTTSAHFDASVTGKGIALGQWAVRFCLLPETLPVFVKWIRSIWPECPYTDDQISSSLARSNDKLRILSDLIEVKPR